MRARCCIYCCCRASARSLIPRRYATRRSCALILLCYNRTQPCTNPVQRADPAARRSCSAPIVRATHMCLYLNICNKTMADPEKRRSLRRAAASASANTPSTPLMITRDSSLLQMEQDMKVANIGSKRQPGTQSISFSTPSREHISSRQKTTNSPIVPIAGVIKVGLSSSTASKDGELWYKGVFDVTLSNKKRCRVFSNKEDWLRRQYNGVMDKLQKILLPLPKRLGWTCRPSY